MDVYDKPVSFQVWSVWVYSLSRNDVQMLDHDSLVNASRHDGNNIGQDGKGLQQDKDRQGKLVSSWAEPWSELRVRDDGRNIKHVQYFTN